jgi:hypothetical protein
MTHGTAAISFTTIKTKVAMMTHGAITHRYLAGLEVGLRAAGAESRAMLATLPLFI